MRLRRVLAIGSIKVLHDCWGYGYNNSLEMIEQMFMNWGVIMKDDYAKALRAYQAYLVEIKRPQRVNLLH
jgi:hypothetical protein